MNLSECSKERTVSYLVKSIDVHFVFHGGYAFKNLYDKKKKLLVGPLVHANVLMVVSQSMAMPLHLQHCFGNLPIRKIVLPWMDGPVTILRECVSLC